MDVNARFSPRTIGLALLLVAGVAGYLWMKPSYVVVGAPVGSGKPVVVLLHGYGAPPKDLVPRAWEWSERLPGATFIVPGASHSVGLGGRSWHPTGSLEAAQEGLQASMDQIHRILRDVERAGVEENDVYLGGFSQGAAMAVHVLTESAEAPAAGGLLVLSGSFFTERGFATDRATDHLPEGFRVLVTHAHDDRVVAFGSGQRVAAFFEDRGLDVRLVTYKGGHRIAPEVSDAVVEFLQGR